MTRRVLPVLAINWMFWPAAVLLVYLLPLPLQVPLAVMGTAIWALLLNSASRPSPAPVEGVAVLAD